MTSLSTDGQHVKTGHSELREDRAGRFSWSIFLVLFNTHHLPQPHSMPGSKLSKPLPPLVPIPLNATLAFHSGESLCHVVLVPACTGSLELILCTSASLQVQCDVTFIARSGSRRQCFSHHGNWQTTVEGFRSAPPSGRAL